MKLSRVANQRADDDLRAALAKAKADDPIRAILILETDSATAKSESAEPKPSQFSSRVKYREAMIDKKRSDLSESIGPTILGLRELSLTVHGGRSTRAVVVEGRAGDIARGLELPGVRSAALDEPLDSISSG